MKRSWVITFFFAAVGAGIALTVGIVQGYDIQDIPSVWLSWIRRLAGMVKGKTIDANDSTALAADLIAGFEGFSPKAYFDVNGYAIGYGHHGGVSAGDTWTEPQAWDALLADISASYKPCVRNAVMVPLTPQQEAALISLCYNIGCQAFQNSTLVGLLNSGNYADAANQFAVWKFSSGQINQALVDRRAKEQEVFQS